jgi:hypothetical protein
MVRQRTQQLLELVQNGLIDRDFVIMAFCSYCSEDEVADMMRSNDILIEDEDEDEGEDE